jgi:hypothetical protein
VLMDQEPVPESANPKGYGFGQFVVVALVIFLLYALSVGSVFKMCVPGPGMPPAIRHFYSPLEFLYKHVSPVTRFYDWYFHVWHIK